MTKNWCSGQGTEVELLDEPFQTVSCPVCGRSNLGAIEVIRGSQTFGKVPKHGAKPIGPDEIPDARFKDHDWERQQQIMQDYLEYQRKMKR